MLFDRRFHLGSPPINLRCLAVVGAGLAASCASHPVRSVVEVVPADISYQLEVQSMLPLAQLEGQGKRPTQLALVDDKPLSGEEIEEALQAFSAQYDVPAADADGADAAYESAVSMDGDLLGQGITQLDPELGPMDLGYPLLVDLGAGEAPYDDGVRTIHGVELTRSGFSDSVLQASWREQWSMHSMVQITCAFSRYQDLGIMDGLDETRFAWCVLGWTTSF